MLRTHAVAAPASRGRLAIPAALFLASMIIGSGLPHAQPAPPAPAPLVDNAVEVLPKTIIYGVMAAAIDVAIGSVITGDVVSGTAMAVVASGSGWLLYQVHEMAWAELEPGGQSMAMRTETFTVANVLRLFSVGMLFTGDVVLSGTFVVLDGVGEAAAYMATDGIWSYIVQPLAAKMASRRGM